MFSGSENKSEDLSKAGDSEQRARHRPDRLTGPQ